MVFRLWHKNCKSILNQLKIKKMKKISLMVACLGLISAATFANGRHPLNDLQEGSKVQKAEKVQPASTTKTQKAEPIVKKTEATPQKTEAKQKTPSEKPAPAKGKKPIKTATGVMKATPTAPVNGEKK